MFEESTQLEWIIGKWNRVAFSFSHRRVSCQVTFGLCDAQKDYKDNSKRSRVEERKNPLIRMTKPSVKFSTCRQLIIYLPKQLQKLMLSNNTPNRPLWVLPRCSKKKALNFWRRIFETTHLASPGRMTSFQRWRWYAYVLGGETDNYPLSSSAVGGHTLTAEW